MREGMKSWIVTPRDPVIVRDGRPFGPDPGARSESLPFPYPSTIAGAVRTRHGQQHGGFGTGGVTPDSVLSLSVQGPFLVQLADHQSTDGTQLLLPAPHDALLLQKTATMPVERSRLCPLAVDSEAHSDLHNTDAALWYVGMAAPDKSKPYSKAPTFWWWPAYQAWLEDPQDGAIDDAMLGIRGLVKERRVHVRIDADSGSADEGFLFQTSGLEFSQQLRRNGSSLPQWALAATKTYGIYVATQANISAGVGSLGGERRTVFWQRAERIGTHTCPEEIKKAISQAKACRMILATPALFADGWKPRFDWLGISGLQVAVKAAIVNRYDVVSGWDYAAQRPKKTRRLVPAGAVYYLSLAGSDAGAIEQFIDRVWFQPASDAEQDRLDGFGTALLGTWNGKQTKQEVQQ